MLKDAFCGYEKAEKKFWFCDLFKDSAFQQLKGMQTSKLPSWTK